MAFVSGAARGIGAAIAERLVKDGYLVVLGDSNKEKVMTTAEALGPAARWVHMDVSSESDVIATISSIRDIEGHLDLLVSNAGVWKFEPLKQVTLAQWNRTLSVNLTAAFLLARASEDMLRERKGSMILISSTRAHQSEPGAEAYAASKGGLVALTHALASSMAPVRVNCVVPGWIHTGPPAAEPSSQDHSFHWTGRVGQPRDIGGLVAFLAGPDAGFINGAEIMCDGGVSRKMIYPE